MSGLCSTTTRIQLWSTMWTSGSTWEDTRHSMMQVESYPCPNFRELFTQRHVSRAWSTTSLVQMQSQVALFALTLPKQPLLKITYSKIMTRVSPSTKSKTYQELLSLWLGAANLTLSRVTLWILQPANTMELLLRRLNRTTTGFQKTFGKVCARQCSALTSQMVNQSTLQGIKLPKSLG